MQQAPKPIFATIPDPTADVAGLYKTVLALKNAAEQIIGMRTGPIGNERKASIFVTDQHPDAGQEGDFWLCKGGEQTTLSMMIAGQWKVIWQ